MVHNRQHPHNLPTQRYPDKLDEKSLKKLAGIYDKSPKGKAKRRSKIRADSAKKYKKARQRGYKARGWKKPSGDTGG